MNNSRCLPLESYLPYLLTYVFTGYFTPWAYFEYKKGKVAIKCFVSSTTAKYFTPELKCLKCSNFTQNGSRLHS